MDFTEAREYVESEFSKCGFDDSFSKGLFNTHKLVVGHLGSGSSIELSFPGTKPAVGVFDFRVDLHKRGDTWCYQLSHVNYLVDIAFKCRVRPSMIPYIRKAICNIYERGLYKMVYLPCGCEMIGSDLIREVEKIHSKIFLNGVQKRYHSFSNRQSLAYEDLFISIFWVYLQEDINYPPPALGRELPFKLYIEFLDSFDTVDGGDLDGAIRKILEH